MTNGWETRRPNKGSASSRGYGEQWRRLRLMILQRDRWWCQVRVSPKCQPDLRINGARNAHVDHIVPVSEGGAFYDPANLRAPCRWCNIYSALSWAGSGRRPSASRTGSTDPP